MFPIGRYLTLSADDSFPKNPEELSVGYIFNNPECGDGIETHTVREWFRSFNIPLKMTISLHGQEHRQHSANIYNFWKNTYQKRP